ncbi:MAG: hypothetical protein IKE70_01380 [Bacilli bacterium]|nr:hypothetical protein [Bacilli bacterium]
MNNQVIFIGSILTNRFGQRTVENLGNWRRIKNKEVDIPINGLFLSGLEANTKEILIQELENPTSLFTATIVIDSKILQDEEIMEKISEKAKKSGSISIRIDDKGYILTKENYDRLKVFSTIFVDYCTDELKNEKNIITQLEIFKGGIQIEQPVIERRNRFDEEEIRLTFHINHPLTNEEISTVVLAANESLNACIELNCYSPNDYENFIKRLQEFGLKDNCNITLIGYPLEDASKLFKSLEKYPYQIDIIYSTCHDLVKLYEEEPYVEKKLLYSQLEGSGKTTLSNYINILKTLEEVEEHVREKNYSPLEAAIYAKTAIDEMYIYDPDYQSPDVDLWDNTNLSQVINHTDGTKKRAICVGFSTLYSAMLRRNKIPMFRYSAPEHMRNIGRIQDDKYQIDTLSIFDITYDLESSNHRKSFSYFGLSPRTFTKSYESEFLTIANSLILPAKTFQELSSKSKDPIESFFHRSYDPLGYTYRMLELMGYIDEKEQIVDIFRHFYELSRDEHLEDIPIDKILQAYIEVEKQENNISKEEEQRIIRDFYETLNKRELIFQKKESILCNQDIPPYSQEVEVVTKENASNLINDLENDTNTPRPIFFKKGLMKEENGNIVIDLSQYQKIEDNASEKEEDSDSESDVIWIDDNSEEKQENSDSESDVIWIEDTSKKIGKDNNSLIPGTHIKKPREREIYESDEEYESYLRKYYSLVFPSIEDTQKENIFIEGTDILKPRERDIYESDEEYEKFLSEYYNMFFPDSKKQEENNKVR